MRRFPIAVWALSAGLGFRSVAAQEPPAAPAVAEAAPTDAKAPAAGDALPDLSAEVIAERVQAFYDGAKTFQANFTQRYTIFAYNKKKESQGKVVFVKPGKMSWRYTSNGNRVVSDGKLLKVYEADNKQLFEQDMTKSAYPAALSFLLGEGKLASFVIGVLVIFAYYIVMFLSESLTKGHYLNMYLTRWLPNIVLGVFGVAALVWRSRFIDGRLPISVGWATRLVDRVRARWQRDQAAAAGQATPKPGVAVAAGRAARARGGAPVLVIVVDSSFLRV